MSVFENREFNGHELVTFGNDGPTALRAIVAVHSTALGPAATLARGYAVVQSIAASGEPSVLRSVSDAPSGTRLRVRVPDGVISAVIDGTE